MLMEFYRKNKVLAVTIVIVCGMLLFALIIKPIVVGYTTYQKAKAYNYSIDDYGKNMQELKDRLLVSSTNLSACVDLNDKFSAELEKYLDKASECAGSLKALEINSSLSENEYENHIAKLQQDLDAKSKELNNIRNDKDAEINNLKSQYDLLAQNAANNICCKMKVDNSKIKYYRIENSKVLCLEEGTTAISC